MITIQSRISVTGITGREIVDFLINATDREYQAWWPGTHLHFHTVKKTPTTIGNIVYMDEFVGKRRIKMQGVVTEVAAGKRITWQLKKIIRLPIWLTVGFDDNEAGVAITHTIRAGFAGISKLFDPIFRLYFSTGFAKAMDEHVRVEFPKLGAMLQRGVLCHED
jgi:hypothetical protein